jgi:hypothetical protein
MSKDCNAPADASFTILRDARIDFAYRGERNESTPPGTAIITHARPDPAEELGRLRQVLQEAIVLFQEVEDSNHSLLSRRRGRVQPSQSLRPTTTPSRRTPRRNNTNNQSPDGGSSPPQQ